MNLYRVNNGWLGGSLNCLVVAPDSDTARSMASDQFKKDAGALIENYGERYWSPEYMRVEDLCHDTTVPWVSDIAE